jgi:hypothetical protein
MNEKRFEIPLDDLHLITVYYLTRKGVVVDFCIRLMRESAGNGGLECLSRFDDSHGYAHQDILGASGNIIGKPKFNGLPFTSQVIEHAIAHFKLTYKHYGIVFDGN